MMNEFNDDIFVIDCWPNNQSKENDLIGLIKILKEFNIPILLSGHYLIKPEIQNMVDYYLFDKNNDLLLESEFEQYNVNSGRWSDIGDWRVENKNEFHHDYAIWCTMRNAFNFANTLGKKYIHFLEYDNLPDPVQYRQAFLEYSRYHDAVLYEYHEGSVHDKHFSEFCATFIFSIRTEIALKVIDKVKNKYEYFTNRPKGWQLERVFLQHLKEVTDRIFISKYIANNNELNTQAVWNRDGMDRNGAIFQVYSAGNFNQDLYLHFLSGFHERPAESDYLVEINYKNFKRFHNIKKNDLSVVNLGKYEKDEVVKVYYEGIEVYRDILKDDFDEFRRKNKIIFRNEEPNPNIKFNFVDGPFVEILENYENEYRVQFINKNTNTIVHEQNIKSNHWVRLSLKYYIDWIIKIEGVNNNFRFQHDFDLSEKRCLISIETKSLGDSLAFIPQIEKFRKLKNIKLICSSFYNKLFKENYPEIEFVEPGTIVNDLYSMYRIGVFFDGDGNNKNINYTHHKFNPLDVPLMKVASDILGMDYEELIPNFKKIKIKKKKQVSIAIHSTAQCKYWNNPTGWQEVVDYLKSKNYDVLLLSKEEDGYMGNKNPRGVKSHPVGSLEKIISALQQSELFIGISSGLSWLSWAVGTPTIIVSGFTDVDLEPTIGVNRVINKNVCNGCWSKHIFDPGDWNWCPIQKGTDKQFECSKEITSEMVINEIEKLLN